MEFRDFVFFGECTTGKNPIHGRCVNAGRANSPESFLRLPEEASSDSETFDFLIKSKIE